MNNWPENCKEKYGERHIHRGFASHNACRDLEGDTYERTVRVTKKYLKRSQMFTSD